MCNNGSAFLNGLKMISEVKPDEIAAFNVEAVNQADGELSSVYSSPASEGVKVDGAKCRWFGWHSCKTCMHR